MSQTMTVQRVCNAIERMPFHKQVEVYNRLKPKVEHPETDIVAYTAEFEPLTRKQYIAEINEAIEEGKRGETISNEDYLKERATWK